MKKLAIAITVVLMAGLAFGVTTITYNIPDAYGLKLLNALIAQSGARIRIEVWGLNEESEPGSNTYHTVFDFDTPTHDPNVPNAEFVKKRVAFIADAFKVSHERKVKNDAHKTYMDSAPSVDVNEPDSGNMN